MTRKQPLWLYEELLLLALNDEKGTPVFGVQAEFAVGGALLAELLMAERVRLDGTGRKARLQLADHRPLGDELLDECLAKVRDAKRSANLQTWVTRFARLPRLRRRASEGLVRRYILRRQEGRVLLFFPHTTFPERDPGPERELVSRLKRAITHGTSRVDPRSAVLISLASKTGLLRQVFRSKEERAQLKRCKSRIAAIVAGEATGRAAKQAIDAMNAAIVATCVVPAVVASSASH
ncbi:MAG: GOLPH3/VPS74 family protein [Planctomycetota bacterium]|jgi:hypothetical protein